MYGHLLRVLLISIAKSFHLDDDDTYQYRHVILDKEMVSLMPKNRLMNEMEWRALGIKQGPHWEHYLIHKPGNQSLYFLSAIIFHRTFLF